MARKSRPGRRRTLCWPFAWYFAAETRAPPGGEGPESAAYRLSLPPARRQAKRLGLEQSAADLLDGTSIDRLECERDALAAADAHGDDPAPEAVETHRMDEAGCQHRPGCAERMPVGDRAAFDIDDGGRKPEVARDGEDDRGEGLVDLDALDIAEPPPRSVERLTDGRDRPEAEHAGLDRGDAIGDEARDRCEAALVRPVSVGEDDGGRAAVYAGRIARGDRPVLAECRPQRGERFQRRLRPIGLIRIEYRLALPAGKLDQNGLHHELSTLLRRREALLRAKRPFVLRRAADLEFLGEILGVPA